MRRSPPKPAATSKPLRPHDNHLAHIRFAALRRLRGVYPFDTATEEAEDAGNRMFGEAA